MTALEFSACIGPDGRLTVPVSAIPAGSPVRVIVLTDEKDFPVSNKEMPADGFPSLDEVIREIKNSPQNPKNIRPASGLLGKHLSESDEKPDPCFSFADWNREWDRIESEMKAEEVAEQESEEQL
jgi:hypothetical protein